MERNSSSLRSSRPARILVGVCLALGVVGIALWLFQLTNGMVNTNMRQLNSWGLYIVNFMFFVGLSAGGLIISSVPKVFGIEGFGPISKVAVWASVVCTCLAGAFIVIDLGNPLRMWELFTFQNLASPLLWDVIVIFSYLAISIVYLVLLGKYERGEFGHAAMRVYSTVALVLAIMVHSVTAWIFSLNVSREFWHTALMAPWFVVSALASGLALVMIVCVALSKAGQLDFGRDNLVKMGKFLAVFVMVDIYFFGCDVLTSAYGNDGGREIVHMLLAGPLAPFFWTEIVSGIAAAVICLVPSLRKVGLITLAAALAILSVFCKRCQIILAGFGMVNLPSAGLGVNGFPLTGPGQALADTFSSLAYFPSPLELAIVVCMIFLGIGVFTFGVMHLSGQEGEAE